MLTPAEAKRRLGEVFEPPQAEVLAAGMRLVFSYGKLVVPAPRVDTGRVSRQAGHVFEMIWEEYEKGIKR